MSVPYLLYLSFMNTLSASVFCLMWVTNMDVWGLPQGHEHSPHLAIIVLMGTTCLADHYFSIYGTGLSKTSDVFHTQAAE